MVQGATFSFHLADARTRQPLPERVDAEGKVWVKGTPGDEFFLVLGRRTPGAQAKAFLKVDGAVPGYDFCLATRPSGPHFCGARAPTDEKNRIAMQAFRFVRREDRRDEGDAPASDQEVGKVCATFRRVEPQPQLRRGPEVPWMPWQAARDAGASAHKKEQAALRAEVGATNLECNLSTNTMVLQPREVIERFTIHYTTDFGLAVRGLGSPAPARSDEDPKVKDEAAPPAKRAKRAGDSKEEPIALD